MESVLNKEIESIEVEIRYLTWKLEKTKENLEKLKNGDINIYI
jgi:chaperonin cofactor prefoldin